MKIEIRLIDDVRYEHGRLLEIIEVSGSSYSRTQEAAVAAMVQHARLVFGSENYEAVTDTSIFGGYYRHRYTRDCIVAR
jgi:ferritin-like metal-binding protein YciE